MPAPIYVTESDDRKEFIYDSVALHGSSGLWYQIMLPTAQALSGALPLTYDIPGSSNPAKRFEISYNVKAQFNMLNTTGDRNAFRATIMQTASLAATPWNIDGKPIPQAWLGDDYQFNIDSKQIRKLSIPSITMIATFDLGFPIADLNSQYPSALNYLQAFLSLRITMFKK